MHEKAVTKGQAGKQMRTESYEFLEGLESNDRDKIR